MNNKKFSRTQLSMIRKLQKNGNVDFNKSFISYQK